MKSDHAGASDLPHCVPAPLARTAAQWSVSCRAVEPPTGGCGATAIARPHPQGNQDSK